MFDLIVGKTVLCIKMDQKCFTDVPCPLIGAHPDIAPGILCNGGSFFNEVGINFFEDAIFGNEYAIRGQ
ncbi:hypothetical protein D3C87_1309960 [compost metagenome]